MEPLLIGAAALGLVAGFVVGFLLKGSQERTQQERLKASAEDDSSSAKPKGELEGAASAGADSIAAAAKGLAAFPFPLPRPANGFTGASPLALEGFEKILFP